jgi:catechol 2,3-dioxygenase-like lactoylglutathione lyase family enzyme
MVFAGWGETQSNGRVDALEAPHFHHLHLNSMDPDAAIEFYMKQFPSTTKASVAGFPALKAGNVYVLFTKVSSPPPTEPQTAIWHFGWHVVDVRKNLELYKQRKEVHLLPLYTTDEGGTVLVSSDTWPGTGGLLGLTKVQIAEAKARGVEPRGGAGFAYLQGPDRAIVEYQGDMPVERFNHVHMYQENPFCAQLWYQKHLNAPSSQNVAGQAPHTEADCKVERSDRSWPALEKEGMIRQPSAGVSFDDVAMNWYERQGDHPLVSTRGHLADHVALSVSNLEAWIAKLRGEGVKFLEQPYKFGDTRAVMIEGPSREALELVEIN